MRSASDISLDIVIRQHIAAVERRVGNGAYAKEAAEIRRAAALVSTLRSRLGLTTFRRTLNPGSSKPQFLLAFESPEHGNVALKVYGRRRPDEAVVQRTWYQAGVATIEVLASGNDPTSWLLMPEIPGQPPEPNEAARLTPQVGQLVAEAHHVSINQATRSLRAGVVHHLHAVLQAAVAHRYMLPHGWEKAANAYESRGRIVAVHGDLTVKNLLRDRKGRLLMLDTCGYAGPPEFDAARWSARAGGSHHAVALLAIWLQAEPDLDSSHAQRLLGLEMLMEAGVREIIKDERHESWSERDEETMRCIDLAAELLACPKVTRWRA